MDPNITPELVLHAYRSGVFPMADEGGEIYWFSPDPRCILPLETFHVAHSLRQVLRRGVFEVRVDTAFDEVMAACADRREGTWISDEIIAVYRQLHRRRHAHSVESWQEGRLVGGLYGVALGGAFFGESMFTRVSNASKVALAHLVERLKQRGYALLDAQWSTPHLRTFGAVEIPRREYLRRLRAALTLPCEFGEG
jgi:leucyl/phenylalanyl-tRNA--protein transferase